MRITFCGAARSVTGSCYLVETASQRFLVDCGLFQERVFQSRNWDPFPFDPAGLDFVLLTHAHIDHIGRLPLLVKQGFTGPIHCTRATADLVELLLLDSAHIQEEDAKYKSKRHRKEGRDAPPVEPLYGTKDAYGAIEKVSAIRYDKDVEVADGVVAHWNDAGHMLGSGHIALDLSENGKTKRVVFSGDIGVPDRVILRDPEPFRRADVAICESTYGDRLHENRAFAAEKLRDVINATLARGGNVVIPSFAVGRTQTLLYHMRRLMESDQIPPVTTFVDSPMAVEATGILRRHPECFDEEARALVEAGEDPVGFEPLHFASSTSASKAINRIKGCVIISASGMCTAGRIKHHLAHNLGRSESTILFVGYQAKHTLGRIILEGAEEVRILGRMQPVRARVETINGLSGHADRDGMLAWLRELEQPPEKVFLTHGDEEVALRFADTVRDATGWTVEVPEYGSSAEL